MKFPTKYFLFLTAFFLFQNIQAQQLDHILGDVLIQIPDKATPDNLVRELQNFNGNPTSLIVVRKLRTVRNIWLLNFDHNQINENHFLAFLRDHRSVELAQFNHLLTERQTIPDDPQFFQQWHWVNDGSGNGTFDADVDADLAWDITTGGTTIQGDEIVVCVMEGANRNHEDLQGNLWFNPYEIPGDNIDNDNNGYIDDIGGWNNAQNNGNIPTSGHGTAVSGMIGAKGNNNLGVTGINWNVKIMHVNVGSLNDANVMEAYTYPLIMRRKYNESGGAEGAFVVATNASWGIDGGQPSEAPLWCNIYDDLGAEGVLNCGATANVDWDIDAVGDLPTACPSEFMVSVTATNNSDLRTFSAYGLNHVDLGAPGSNVYTLSGNGYNSTSGTSFASPLTAGVIALLYSAPCNNIGQLALSDPQGAALLIRDYLFNGVDPTPQLQLETVTGGRVNVFNSLQLLMQDCGGCSVPYALNATNVIDTSALLSWYQADSVISVELRYRLADDTTWTIVQDAVSPFLLSGLAGCDDYVFQVAGMCGDTSTAFSDSFAFSTEGCCFAPGNIIINPISDDEIEIVWDSAYAALGYIVHFKDQNATEWNSQTVNVSSAAFGDLSVCTIYEFELATLCTPDSVSEFSQTLVYTMDCPCDLPLTVDTVDVFTDNATIVWDACENADTYLLRYRRFGLVDWQYFQTNDLFQIIDSLLPCTFYQYQIQTVCPIANSDFSIPKNFKTDCISSNIELETISDIGIYPNPFTNKLLLEFELAAPKDIIIRLYNPAGQLMVAQYHDQLAQGHNQLLIENLDHLAKGIYFLKMNIDGQFVVRKIVKD